MTDERTNKATLVIGGIGSGKTSLGQNLAFLAAHRENLAALKKTGMSQKEALHKVLTEGVPPNLPILAVGTEDHPAYRKGYTRITPRQIKSIDGAPGYYRCFGDDVLPIEAALMAHARNAVVLIEDASEYMEGKLTDEQKRFILRRKQRNLDLIYMFHMFGMVPPKIYGLVNHIYILKTQDKPQESAGKVPAIHLVKQAYESVMGSTEKYPREVLKLN